MIRPAVPSDRDAVIVLLEHSRQAAGFDDAGGLTGFCFPFRPPYAGRLFAAHLGQPDRLCLVLDDHGAAQGVLMAVAAEHPFGPVRLARETVWWIEPDYRGPSALRMLADYEAWAKGQGCDFVGMAGMGADPSVGRLYERRGFRPAEVHYLKAL